MCQQGAQAQSLAVGRMTFAHAAIALLGRSQIALLMQGHALLQGIVRGRGRARAGGCGRLFHGRILGARMVERNRESVFGGVFKRCPVALGCAECDLRFVPETVGWTRPQAVANIPGAICMAEMGAGFKRCLTRTRFPVKPGMTRVWVRK